MADIIRDAPLGQVIRYFTRNKYLQYPEEKPGWKCPRDYAPPDQAKSVLSDATSPSSADGFPTPATEDTIDLEKAELWREETAAQRAESETRVALEQIETGSDLEKAELEPTPSGRSQLSKISTRGALKQSHTQADLERAFSVATLAKEKQRPIAPEKLEDGTILVDWYTTDDPDQPQNWSFGKKMLASTQIYCYTLSVYMGSAIYSPSIGGVSEAFGVSVTTASLGLALYVFAYGIGPLLWSPLSEIPAIGRNPPYVVTFAIFVLLSVGAALVDNLAGLLVLRFLQGFFGSPCLATGGASLQDMYSIIHLPYVMCLWALSATCGPALGPIISGFSVTAENWHWSLWEIVWLAGPIWLIMFMFLPETSPSNILLRRAQRLRRMTGDSNLKSQSEIDQKNMKFKDVAVEALYRPMQLMFMDPSIAFTAVYIALVYAIFYSFFEVFPLVYIDLYHFNLGEMGLTFLSVAVGVILSISTYYAFVYYTVEPEIRAHGLGAPERRLRPALVACFFPPVGLFIFGWTGNGQIHWIVSCIGICIVTIGVFLLIQVSQLASYSLRICANASQCVFMYLPLSYPQYAASLFAGNDFARSTLAAAAILFSRPMFQNLGIGPGTSLLGALTACCIVGIFILFFYGDKLRARSKFAAK